MSTHLNVPIIALIPIDDEEIRSQLDIKVLHHMDEKDTFFFHRTLAYEHTYDQVIDLFGQDCIRIVVDKNAILKVHATEETATTDIFEDIQKIFNQNGAVLVEVFTTKKLAKTYGNRLGRIFNTHTIIEIDSLTATSPHIYGSIYSARFFGIKEYRQELNVNQVKKLH